MSPIPTFVDVPDPAHPPAGAEPLDADNLNAIAAAAAAAVRFDTAQGLTSAQQAIAQANTGIDPALLAAAAGASARTAAPSWAPSGPTLAHAEATRPAIVAIGSSVSQNNYTVTDLAGSGGVTSAWNAIGYAIRALVALRWRVSFRNAGVGGNTSAMMLARFATDVVAYKPPIVIIEGSTNDPRTSVPSATTEANMLAMFQAAFAAGCKVVTTTIPPAGDTTTAQRQTVQATNMWLRDYARANPQNLALVDWWALLANPLTDGYKTGMSIDGIHPSSLGAFTLAQPMADAIARFLPPGPDPLPSANVNDTSNLLTNPLLTGTGGTLLAGGTPSGSVADSWLAVGTSTPTYACSKVPRPDGLGEWQQVAISSAAGQVEIFAAATGAWSAGNIIDGVIEFQTDAAGWVDGTFDCLVECVNGATVTNVASALSTGSLETTVQGRHVSGVLRTAPIVIPTGTATVRLHLRKSNTGTVRWGRAAINKRPQS